MKNISFSWHSVHFGLASEVMAVEIKRANSVLLHNHTKGKFFFSQTRYKSELLLYMKYALSISIKEREHARTCVCVCVCVCVTLQAPRFQAGHLPFFWSGPYYRRRYSTYTVPS